MQRNAKKDRCIRGHLLAGHNLRVKTKNRHYKDGTPYTTTERECVECHRLHLKVFKWRQKYPEEAVVVTPEMFRPRYREPK